MTSLLDSVTRPSQLIPHGMAPDSGMKEFFFSVCPEYIHKMQNHTPECHANLQGFLFAFLICEKEKGHHSGPLSQVSPIVTAGPDPSWELGTQTTSLTWVEGTQLLEPSPLPVQVCISRRQELEPLIRPRYSDMGHSILTGGFVTRPSACL